MGCCGALKKGFSYGVMYLRVRFSNYDNYYDATQRSIFKCTHLGNANHMKVAWCTMPRNILVWVRSSARRELIKIVTKDTPYNIMS